MGPTRRPRTRTKAKESQNNHNNLSNTNRVSVPRILWNRLSMEGQTCRLLLWQSTQRFGLGSPALKEESGPGLRDVQGRKMIVREARPVPKNLMSAGKLAEDGFELHFGPRGDILFEGAKEWS